MSEQHGRHGGGPPKPPYLAAACAGAGVFLLYVLTLAPSTSWWDTSEYIATAHTLGLPHPPGNPLFVAAGRTWSVLLSPLGLSPAVRINLLAAATSAGASFFFFLIVHRTLVQLRGAGREALVGAGVAVVVSATAFTVWSQSNTNEKVYTISLLIAAAVTWLMMRWWDRRQDPRSVTLVVLAVYLMALGATNHLMSVLPAGAVLVFILLTRPRLLVHTRFLSWCVGAVVVGLSFNFFLPIRAAERPVINEGDPLCDGVVETAVAIYTNGAAGCPALAASLRRDQYAKPPVTTRMAPFSHQLVNFFQYFDWQWSRGLDRDEPPSRKRLPFSLLFLGLGGLGFFTVWKGDRKTGAYFLVFAATLSVALVFYLNFRYGYSLAPEITGHRTHEVRERDYFFLLFFALWGAMAGLGVARLWLWLADRMGSLRNASPVLAVAVIPFFLNLSWANRAGDYAARDWAYDLLNSMEPYAVIFTNGDNDTFPLWYLQEVEEIRQDVTVVVVQYLFTEWYAKQLRERTEPGQQRPFVPVQGLPFADREPPVGPVIALTDEEIESVEDGLLRENLDVRMGNMTVQFPRGMDVRSGHRLALAIIDASSGERPIYFASRDGEMADMELSAWGVSEGLAVRLHMRDLDGEQPPEYRQTGMELGGEWFNYPRSRHLVDEVYSYRSLREREIWQDYSTKSIVYGYYRHTALLAAIAEVEGDMEASLRYQEMAREFVQVYFGGTEAIRARSQGGGG
ncbi:MAG: DUF2723 domain-containing protein, partial [Gemmatimonadetes bacterium]|nr:DUF2723 domain-containing protein [Gemmatimonadota bacterium]